MSNPIKLLRRMIEDAGCTVDEMKPNNYSAQFFVAVIVAPDGVHKSQARLPKFRNESDQHGERNEAARIKRFAREFPATQISVAVQEQAPEVFKIIQKLAHPPAAEFIPDQTFDQFISTIDREHEEQHMPEATTPSAVQSEPALSTEKPPKGQSQAVLVKARAKQRLSMAQSYQLIEWVKTHVETETLENWVALTLPASKALGFEVTLSAAEKAMKILGFRLKPAKVPKPPRTVAIPRYGAGVIHLMLIEIGRLQTACHVLPTEDFSALIKLLNEEQKNERKANEAASG